MKQAHRILGLGIALSAWGCNADEVMTPTEFMKIPQVVQAVAAFNAKAKPRDAPLSNDYVSWCHFTAYASENPPNLEGTWILGSETSNEYQFRWDSDGSRVGQSVYGELTLYDQTPETIMQMNRGHVSRGSGKVMAYWGATREHNGKKIEVFVLYSTNHAKSANCDVEQVVLLAVGPHAAAIGVDDPRVRPACSMVVRIKGSGQPCAPDWAVASGHVIAPRPEN